MSGVVGAGKIRMEDTDLIIFPYIKKIKEDLKNYIDDIKIIGSYYSGQKELGDFDVILLFKEGLYKDKKEAKKLLIKYIEQESESVFRYFINPKHKHRRYYNAGELITLHYQAPKYQDRVLDSCQIDNIIALNKNEFIFKRNFLNLRWDKQGLFMGLMKVVVDEIGADKTLDIFNENIKIPEDKKLELSLSSQGLELRIVPIYDKLKPYDKKDIIKYKKYNDWNILLDILAIWNIKTDDEYDDMLRKLRNIQLKSRTRIKKFYNKVVTIKSHESKDKKSDKRKSLALIMDFGQPTQKEIEGEGCITNSNGVEEILGDLSPDSDNIFEIKL